MQRRVKHCGEDKAAIQRVGYNGISTFCFRCGESEWEPREPVLRPPPEPMRTADPAPADTGDDWPGYATAWLAADGFGRHERSTLFQCYWSERFRRIIFPLHAGFWTARAVADPLDRRPDGRPKWLSGLSGRQQCVQTYGPADNTKLPCVLTEDILSAAKISMSSDMVVAIPCLGTLPSAAVLARAAAAPIVLWWLDPDAAGQRMAHRGNRKACALGLTSRVVKSGANDFDPKHLTKTDIQRRLTDALAE